MDTRIEVLKTYKIFIGGAFPRTESGRYYKFLDKKDTVVANLCLSSRKDLRNAVVAARNAFGSWSEKSAFNRSQILYRLAEMLEGRTEQFVLERMKEGLTRAKALNDVQNAIDAAVYYAGWADKYQQVFSSVNPVSSGHFNFSVYEPSGVVVLFLDGYVSLEESMHYLAAIICGGNTCIAITNDAVPLSLMSLAEVIQNSDVPGGVVNVLTGNLEELAPHAGAHMDVNGILYVGENESIMQLLREKSAMNIKRFHVEEDEYFNLSPYAILQHLEVKTTWHPVENIGGAGSSY